MFSRFRKDLNIGKPADASTELTLFGKLAKIIAKTDLVGLAADESSVASLFGKLKKVSDKTDLVGADDDLAGASTLFGKIATANAAVALIGAAADDDSVASLFGKLAKLQAKADLVNKAQLVIPTNAADVTVTGGADAHAKGEFVEIVAADTITEQFDIVGVNVSAISGAGIYYLELYSGALASEVLIGAVKFSETGPDHKIQTPLLPANTRISAKISSLAGGAQTADISLCYRK